MEKVCRLCGNASKESMYNIFDKNDNNQQIIQLIKQCLPILIYRNDPLSKEICKQCNTKLNEYNSFQKNTITVHDTFKINLTQRIEEPSVRLYLDTLENAYQPVTLQVNNIRNSRPVRNFASQSQVETISAFTNTNKSEDNGPKIGCIRSLKILTPNLINEKSESQSESNIFITLQDRDGAIHKKRRIAGPKSKTKLFYPQSLLQCALKQINKNLNLIDDNSVSDYTSETADTVMETETSEYSMSRSASQDRDVFTPDSNIDSLDYDINLNEPALCNYCMKKFNNIIELSNHEIGHIKVDLGPKVDSKEFGEKSENYSKLYKDYLARQAMTDENCETVKPELRPKREVRNCRNPCSKTQPSSEEDNNLLVPSEKSVTFSVVNYEIYVNGVPLKSMKKEDRRTCYKNIVINDVKRKYCTLCCHTFKDNWAIEAHYMSDSCQYTCKYCGLKFKNKKLLFENHLKIHKNETPNKIFGPMKKKLNLKRKYRKTGRQIYVGQMNVPPKVKPIKLRQLLEKKSALSTVKIKKEPGLDENHLPSSSNNRERHEPYQAYFCRKCFKVFFDVNEYNKHIRVCNGASRRSKIAETITTPSKVETVKTPKTENPPAEHFTSSGRPVRSCVKDMSNITNDSASDSDDEAPKKSKKENEPYDCSLCNTTFPSVYSRNSHMRIHKGQIPPTQIPLPAPAPQRHLPQQLKTYPGKIPLPKPQTVTKQELVKPKIEMTHSSGLHFANLNPTVARLVQNNPHLTIRSYTKSETDRFQQEQQQPNAPLPKIIDIQPITESTSEHNIKRVYKCADCEDKFENKSVLYYHKMNSCVVKRHYECAFCRKKFGTYDQYNTHMFYVHPE